VWTAASISIFGSLITRIALPLVAILTLNAGPIEVAVLRSMDLVAALIVGLVAGAWVDRLRRRPVLIWADLGRAALLSVIPISFVMGTLALWQLLAVAGLTAVLTTFFDAADNACSRRTVRSRRAVPSPSSRASASAASSSSSSPDRSRSSSTRSPTWSRRRCC
jgi:MFS family permease